MEHRREGVYSWSSLIGQSHLPTWLRSTYSAGQWQPGVRHGLGDSLSRGIDDIFMYHVEGKAPAGRQIHSGRRGRKYAFCLQS